MCPEGLNAKQIAHRCDIALPTTYHLVRTLAYEGYLVRRSNGQYGLGMEIASRFRDLVASLHRPPQIHEVLRQLAEWGVPPSEAVVRDGSGLSRYDYISPRTAVRVLDAMRRSPNFQVFYDALPIAGVDGTIRTRMRGTPAMGNVHAKTGSVAMARSLSGYVTTADGRMLLFSFLANNWTVPVRDVERVQDAICAQLAALKLR